MSASELDSRIERAMETFNEHDLDQHMAAFADGATFVDPVLDGEVSGENHRRYLAEVIEAFPDIHQEVDQVLCAGDPTVIESTFRGTHEGEIEGIPPTGNSVAVPLVSIISVSDEGITSWRDYWDQQTFRDQLGLTVPAVLGHLPRFARWKLADAL
ncbi:ester cyclase [Halobaculum sp. EA56]|uniref:ester cyclase n=1 Tax=Halobaculum sp. EA56 TaxID=3421648 RepID=UPI003EB9C778